MKRFALYICLLLSASACSDKKSPSEIFLDDFFDEEIFNKEGIVCLTYSYTGDDLVDHLDNRFLGDTLIGTLGSPFIVLTRDEKNMIINTLHSIKPDSSHVGFYIDGEFSSSDTINALLQNPKKGWPYFKKRYRGIYYNAAEPIFLRDNTLCVFMYRRLCGECSHADLSIYRKTLFGWKRYVSIYGWKS
ncbi:MAG TPA: hypothetical protein VIM75_07225 [Ohtaekwangia sp.]|uniref:hypothetical protein n=1 Tax=Ohtaekwangia sp. TaxID=2066019 RepID=UPI002F93D935